MATIYIGNLPNDTHTDRAQALFSPFGSVKAMRLTLGASARRFQGFGYVEMDDAAARTAIAELDGSVFDGAIICVHEASRGRHVEKDGNQTSLEPTDDAPRATCCAATTRSRRWRRAPVQEALPGTIGTVMSSRAASKNYRLHRAPSRK